MNVCPQHDEGSGPCNCTYERTAERAARNAAKRVAEGGLAKARAALQSVAVPTYGRKRRHPSTENMRRPNERT